MKRMLAFILTAAMLVSCFVISASAADGEKHEMYVFRPGDTVEPAFIVDEQRDNTAGWNGWCRYADGTNQLIYTYPALNLANATKVTWSAYIGQQLKLDVSQDKSTWKTVYTCTDEFNSDGEHGLVYELRSFDLTEHLDKTGPKTIYVRITDSFNGDGWGGAVGFYDDVTLDITYTGDTVAKTGTIPVMVGEVVKQSKDKGVYSAGDGIMVSKKLDTPVDISGMKFFSFDICFSNRKDDNKKLVDYEMLVACDELNLELTSSGTCDTKENAIVFNLGDYVTAKNAKAGYANVQIPISAIKDKSSDGGLDPTAFNFFRLFNISDLHVPDDIIEVNEKDESKNKTLKMDVRITNVRFEDASYEKEPEVVIEGEHEQYVFEIDSTATANTPTETEAPFFVEATSNFNGNQRFSDAQAYTRYKYTIKNYASVKKVTWEAPTGAQLLLLVSQDGQNWKEVYRYVDERVESGEKKDAGLSRLVRTYDLTPFLDLSEVKEIWISIEDSYKDGGWGGSVFVNDPVILDVIYEKLDDETLDALEMKATEHSLPIHGCNQGFGKLAVDKTDPQAGSGWVKVTTDADAVNQFVWETPIDATGFDTLEFEMYVSDLDFFEYGDLDKPEGERFRNAWLEIGSAGQCDNSELAWNYLEIREGIVGEPVEGWNHVVLHLSDAHATDGSKGPFDISKFNFLRFFFVGTDKAPAESKGITVGFDTFRFTDDEAVKHAAAVEEAKDCVEKINALTVTSVDQIKTKDELTAAKKLYNSAEKAYKRLSDEAKATLSAELIAKLEAAGKAVEDWVEPKEDESNAGESETGSGTSQETGSGESESGETEAPKKPGCGSVIVSGSVVVVGILAAAGFMMAKKEGRLILSKLKHVI